MTEPHTYSWVISGTYATWTMAITAAPPDPDIEDLPAQLPDTVFTNLTRYFADTVNLYEATREADEARYSYDGGW